MNIIMSTLIYPFTTTVVYVYPDNIDLDLFISLPSPSCLIDVCIQSLPSRYFDCFMYFFIINIENEMILVLFLFLLSIDNIERNESD